MPTSKLDAVNTVLAGVGLPPVSTLDTASRLDVSAADQKIDEISRAIQERGWWFNTDIERVITPNTDNEIVLPTDTLRVDNEIYAAVAPFVQRGTRLYHPRTQSYTDFTDDVTTSLASLQIGP